MSDSDNDSSDSNNSTNDSSVIITGHNQNLIETIIDENGYIVGYNFDNICLNGNNEVPPQQLFPINSLWSSKSSLVASVTEYLSRTGMVAAANRQTITCNRFGATRPTKKKNNENNINEIDETTVCTKRNFKSGDLKIRCKWCIKYQTTVYKKDAKGKSRPVRNNTTPVIIKEACFEHHELCGKDSMTQQFCRTRSGLFVKNVDGKALYDLCMDQLRHGRLTTAKIKEVLKRIWPKNKNVTKGDVFSTRIRIQRILPKLHEDTQFADFQKEMSVSGLPMGLNETFDYNDDEAIASANDIWKEILNQNLSGYEALVSFEQYLKLMSQKKGFSYELFYDSNDYITGAVWMTATMRTNFERFGHYICLDVMKRGINKLLWPYLAMTFYNKLQQICVGCEALMMAERGEAYKAIIDFVCRSAPKRKRENIYVLSGDGFFDQSTLTSFNLPNAKFILDRFHLFDSILKDMFGDYFDGLEQHLLKMAEASTERDFETSLEQALVKVKYMNDGVEDRVVISKLQKFADQRDCYANYKLMTYRATMGRKGSAASEQNHSSVLVYLNDGNKKQSDYCEHLHILIYDLFRRQAMHLNKLNYGFQLEHNKLETEAIKLKEKEGSTHIKNLLLDAVKNLNVNAYERFQKAVEESRYLSKEEIATNFGQNKSYRVRDVRCDDREPRMFNNINDRCDCPARVAYDVQCKHEICLLGRFEKEYFAICHHRRRRSTGSTYGWNAVPEPDDEIEHLESENIDTMHLEGETSSIGEILTIDDDSEVEEIDELKDMNPLHLHSSKVKPMNFQNINKICNSILNNYKLLSEDLQFSVSGTLISLEKLSLHGKMQEEGNMMLPNTLTDSRDSLVAGMKEVINTYNSTFEVSFQTKNTSKETSVKVVETTRKQRNLQSKKRLMPTHEKVRNRNMNQPKVRKKISALPTCGFCMKTGHRVGKNCIMLKHHEQNATTITTNDGRNHLLYRLRNTTKIGYPTPIQETVVSKVTQELKKANIVIHKIIAKCQGPHSRLDMGDMYVITSFITSGGEIQETNKELVVEGREIESMIIAANDRQKQHWIFDKTEWLKNDIMLHQRGSNSNNLQNRTNEIIPNAYVENVCDPFTIGQRQSNAAQQIYGYSTALSHGLSQRSSGLSHGLSQQSTRLVSGLSQQSMGSSYGLSQQSTGQSHGLSQQLDIDLNNFETFPISTHLSTHLFEQNESDFGIAFQNSKLPELVLDGFAFPTKICDICGHNATNDYCLTQKTNGFKTYQGKIICGLAFCKDCRGNSRYSIDAICKKCKND